MYWSVRINEYLKRCVETTLKEKLNSSGAVLIKGPKWCGKSTTAERYAKSSIYMQNTREREQNKAMARNAPDIFLSGKTPKLIDEWQIIPFIWDDIRYEVDHRDKFGQFILTGSATPTYIEYEHSRICRITTLIMRPMSLFESLDSIGTISINDLFLNKVFTPSSNTLELEYYAFLLCRGGWPKSIGQPKDVALNIMKNYYDGLVNDDLFKLDGGERNVEKIKVTLRSYARNESSECSIQTLIDDIKENDNKSISDETIKSYLSALRKIFIIEDIKSWSPNLRSKTAIRTSPTRHFIDPSIGCRALGIGLVT